MVSPFMITLPTKWIHIHTVCSSSKQPIRAFPWNHSVAYFIHLISTLKTDYKHFPQNHSWLTVLPLSSPMAYRPSYSQLRFSWLRPNQSGHLERIHLISLSNLPSTHSSRLIQYTIIQTKLFVSCGLASRSHFTKPSQIPIPLICFAFQRYNLVSFF